MEINFFQEPMPHEPLLFLNKMKTKAQNSQKT